MSILPYSYKAYLLIRAKVGMFLNYASFFDHISSGNKSLIALGQVPQKNTHKVAIYTAHQDFHNDVWESNLLEGIRLMGFQLITVANVEKNQDETNCKFDFTRANRGYDIAACRDVLRILKSIPDELLLINSSTAWDSSADTLIRRAQDLSLSDGHDIVFATQSFQTKEHGQSFFIYSIGDGVNILMQILESARNWKTKRATVYFGEILLTTKLREKKAKVGYLFAYHKLVQKYYLEPDVNSKTHKKLQINFPVNPAHDFWKVLVGSESQFVKRNLFKNKKGKFTFLPKSIEQVFTEN
jgi:hypothetical protein